MTLDSDDLTRQARALSLPLGEALRALGAQCASCESCTSGLAADAISSAPGASAWFEGALACYSERAKHALAGVSLDLIHQRGVVSEEVARAMAAGACERLGVRFAVATTGLAGPGGAASPSGELPQGWVCLAAFDTERSRWVSQARQFEGDREAVRSGAALAAMRLLLGLVAEAQAS